MVRRRCDKLGNDGCKQAGFYSYQRDIHRRIHACCNTVASPSEVRVALPFPVCRGSSFCSAADWWSSAGLGAAEKTGETRIRVRLAGWRFDRHRNFVAGISSGDDCGADAVGWRDAGNVCHGASFVGAGRIGPAHAECGTSQGNYRSGGCETFRNSHRR